MSESSAASSRTESDDLCEKGEESDNLEPLNRVPIPSFISDGTCSFDGEFTLPEDGEIGIGGGFSAIGNESPGEDISFVDGGKIKIKFFSSKAPFNCPSAFVGDSLDRQSFSAYCDFSQGYRVHPTKASDRMWMSPKIGWQAIPTLWFEYGLRLPMHPFFLSVLEALGCGVAQLSPNAVLQINGVIARYEEFKIYPTLELLFSLYRLKTSGAQVYFDKKPGRVKLVDSLSSNSGWHSKWSYHEGDELGRVRPWQRILPTRLMKLTSPFSKCSVDLDLFHGDSPKYNYDDFSDSEFLNSHCCKIYFMSHMFLCLVCCISDIRFLCMQWEVPDYLDFFIST